MSCQYSDLKFRSFKPHLKFSLGLKGFNECGLRQNQTASFYGFKISCKFTDQNPIKDKQVHVPKSAPYRFYGEENPYMRCDPGQTCNESIIIDDILSKLPENLRSKVLPSLVKTGP